MLRPYTYRPLRPVQGIVDVDESSVRNRTNSADNAGGGPADVTVPTPSTRTVFLAASVSDTCCRVWRPSLSNLVCAVTVTTAPFPSVNVDPVTSTLATVSSNSTIMTAGGIGSPSTSNSI